MNNVIRGDATRQRAFMWAKTWNRNVLQMHGENVIGSVLNLDRIWLIESVTTFQLY